ncbi:phosphatidylserine decarboxylase proenzyme, mitochondrial [Ceratina calcarata]|uniref:Phosphatidylserine decarboxylase proenzyme, mitochondrial n=1 Tax=Ceratina calcarata TaxID=156304 RepID=A0AAJ7J1K6_9HYME|nr:phosphatidylserine decarboxylase proenzyme, mitochondrial [Ceratina calcarata]
MSIHRICRLTQGMRSPYKCCTEMSILRIIVKPKFPKANASNISTNQYKNNSWYSFIKQKKWTVPIGVGVSLLATLQWKYMREYSYITEDNDVYEPINSFMVKCYYFLPFRVISRIWGWLASLELPISLRPTLYGFYAKTFDANLEEVALDLSDFPSLGDFFVRPLKYDARPIDQSTSIVSPCDGKVVYFGPVTSCSVQQVKGVNYNLRHFLGDISTSYLDNLKLTKEDEVYIKSLLKNPVLNQLYQLTIYLAPGDYHRFHSPTDWEIEFRRHFQGKLLSVNPKVARYLPDLFSLNEHVVYIGKWAGGFMAYAAVGATNVGSIRVYCDKDLHTNTIKWPQAKHWDDASLGCTHLNKGDLFGEFRMGSTIVLLFEAPKDFKFCVEAGQRIKVGQAVTLTEHTNQVEEEQREREHSL